jgi:hypothetical protein
MENLSNDEKRFLENFSDGLLRILMSKEEIKIANALVKKKTLYKGTSDDKQKTVAFFSI